MRVAFKEWAVIVEALMRGEQILILRKGGIAEGRGGFQVEYPRFWLFPTLFHQQRESVIPAGQVIYDEVSPGFPGPGELVIPGFAEVVDWKRLERMEQVEALRGQHLWKEDVVGEKFEWGRRQNLFVLVIKVFRLPAPVRMPMDESYGGCKSWVELKPDPGLDMALGVPVLEESAFLDRWDRFRMAIRCEGPVEAGQE